ncbi:hypothetical protein HG536_0A06030 [Torulaspora globosa]|uniref:Uncharacterized protein n=1 Tax=Torulaspora globosa TaxID=48254 RepID=A0A7G3ZBA2_9SACH|nr:uncharacterized protein HG536_0A06030 [Torulaspora globosa]QLL30788.1 hypothetical protein HG536_0A06030 [Torulaspora globosa]
MMQADEESASSPERREIDQQLDALLPLSQITDAESEQPRILYELLDEVPHGRKLMNHLLSSASDLQLNEQDLCHGHLHKAASATADRWYEEERRASTQALPAALQLDAPVIFSWSKKAAAAKTSPQKSKPHAAARETTNQTLFKSISARLTEIARQRETLQHGPMDENGSRRSESSASKHQWASSEFHVDPLQEFVARALPRASKKEHSEKKKVKRRSLLNFWGGGTHKRKEDRKATQEAEPNQGRYSTEQSHHIEASSIAEEAEPGRPALENHTQLPDTALNLNSFIPLQPKKK